MQLKSVCISEPFGSEMRTASVRQGAMEDQSYNSKHSAGNYSRGTCLGVD